MASDEPAALSAQQHVARNLAVLRGELRLSQRGLSKKLTDDLGYKLDASGIALIETGARKVSVDDLVALAAALDVSPLRLLLPSERQAESTQRLALGPQRSVSAADAWEWAEQINPWWQDDPRAEADPQEVRYATWRHLRLDLGTHGLPALDVQRYATREDGQPPRESDRIVDASGGLAGDLAELRKLRRGDYGLVLAELRKLRTEVRGERLRRQVERETEQFHRAGAHRRATPEERAQVAADCMHCRAESQAEHADTVGAQR